MVTRCAPTGAHLLQSIKWIFIYTFLLVTIVSTFWDISVCVVAKGLAASKGYNPDSEDRSGGDNAVHGVGPVETWENVSSISDIVGSKLYKWDSKKTLKEVDTSTALQG
jgi:hypothetical protein